MRKQVWTQKPIILTSKQPAEHLFTGWNTHHPFFHYINGVFIKWLVVEKLKTVVTLVQMLFVGIRGQLFTFDCHFNPCKRSVVVGDWVPNNTTGIRCWNIAIVVCIQVGRMTLSVPRFGISKCSLLHKRWISWQKFTPTYLCQFETGEKIFWQSFLLLFNPLEKPPLL